MKSTTISTSVFLLSATGAFANNWSSVSSAFPSAALSSWSSAFPNYTVTATSSAYASPSSAASSGFFYPNATSTVPACIVLVTAQPVNVSSTFASPTFPAFSTTTAHANQTISVTSASPTSTGSLGVGFRGRRAPQASASTSSATPEGTSFAISSSSTFASPSFSVSVTSTSPSVSFTTTFTGTVFSTSVGQASTIYASAVPSGIPLCGGNGTEVVNGTATFSSPLASGTANNTNSNGTSLNSNGDNVPGGAVSLHYSAAAVVLSTIAGITFVGF
ncbi:hypothetical protein CPC08DRAFT_350749 [Agrocybe pediades]|nr:hypothetical protein CPC08DRAFT_350749 [Agrocybe pediades]